MLNDYKPTHDPGLDTFKVQYLLGGSAVLAILFPVKYSFLEVGLRYLLLSSGHSRLPYIIVSNGVWLGEN